MPSRKTKDPKFSELNIVEEYKLVLAQEKVPDKSSEPKVIDALLKDIDVSGAKDLCVCTALNWLPQAKTWPKLKAIIELLSERTIGGKTTVEARYYFSSQEAGAQQFAGWIRGHWSIENPLHWVLDVVFREDAAKARAGFIAENMGFFRRVSMNIIKTVDPDRGLTTARRCCMYEPKYLRGLLGKIFVR